MYKPLADSTLMSMTKKEIIEHLRIVEYNERITQEQIEQQYRNTLNNFIYKPTLLHELNKMRNEFTCGKEETKETINFTIDCVIKMLDRIK